jgi:hypothetical protein
MMPYMEKCCNKLEPVHCEANCPHVMLDHGIYIKPLMKIGKGLLFYGEHAKP